MHRKWSVTVVVVTLSAGFGCGGSETTDELPSSAPTRVEMLADEGFSRASAVEASPDGARFFVAAYDDNDNPGVFTVDASSGEVSPLHVGEPLLYPTDLAVSCDGDTLFVSDFGLAAPAIAVGEVLAELDDGDDEEVPEVPFTGIHALSTQDGTATEFATSGIARASGLALSVDCSTLYVTGFNDAGEPAVFTIPTDGGAAKALYAGEPLMSPTGVHVDAQNIAWVMDHLAAGDGGEGSLFSIDAGGTIAAVVSGLGMGRHGGVSLVPGGTTAVMPVSDELLGSRIITANTATGEMSVLETPDIQAPSGVAAARGAPVMVIAGANSIHIATFDQ